VTGGTHYDGDPLLNVRFTPESIRAHFKGQPDAEALLANMSDESLAEAARRVVPREQQLSDAIFNTFDSVLDVACQTESHRRN
jgi:homoserine kinase